MIRRFQEIGVFPDWWKLVSMTTDAGWRAACAAIEDNDPHTRGIIVLGLEASEEALRDSFAQAAR